ncbi:hypothetical protein [Mycolicibacterium tusciae]|uniref:hypothetical protein n=1 Tax=Mycolicibacterium tusciae TaxID=75922 RepID=UPI0011E581AF|nr:hypothetical protein [Mycolicibacterium tusciae]
MSERTEDFGMATDIEKVIWQRQSVSNELRDGNAAGAIGSVGPGIGAGVGSTAAVTVSEACKDETTGRDR